MAPDHEVRVTGRAAALQPPEVVAKRVELAVRVIELGACVFPLAFNSKKPLIPKDQGGKGFLDAKPDPDMARTFLSNAGQPNYGLAFPADSDVFVLDLDGGDRAARPDWRNDWQRQYEMYGPPGLTFIVRTPSGGRHAYYRWRADLYGPMPPGDEMLGWTVRKPWKGYLVGPGSVINGNLYELAGVDYIADFPEAWARAALTETGAKPGVASAGGPVLTIRGPGLVQSGHRHKYLRDQARYLVGVGLRGDALFTAVMDLNSQLPEPKTADEVRRAIGEAETKFEPDEVTETGEVVRDAPRQSRVYAEDIELALPAIQPFPEDPDPGAFAGLAGEAIESLEGLTSASRVGMLCSLLSAWGGLFGTRTTFHGEQPSVLFTVLVGETGRARKGTTTSAVWTALSHAMTSGFMSVPISANRWDGLASGEALVRTLSEAKGSDPGKPVFGLIVEEEFERLLRRMRSSEGYQSTLDVYLRQAFDARMIQHLTAAKSVRVQPPYGVSILGNVTRETLRQNVSPDMARSGFANRFLWIPIQERDVAISGAAAWHFPEGIQNALREARIAWAGGAHIAIADDALDLLNDYAHHLRELVGLAGAMGARLHVIAARVALIHAAIDRSDVVHRGFVERAIALTEYARSGMTWAFRDDVGDEDANTLFAAVLGRFVDGLSTREAQAVVGRSQRFMKARDLLIESGHIRLQTVTNRPQTDDKPSQTSGGGRPQTRLYAIDRPGFGRFLPTGSTNHPHEESGNHGSSDSRSTNRHKPPTNRLLTVPNRSETSDPDLTVAETPDVHVRVCHFYADHQGKHERRGELFICTICDPEFGSEETA